LKKDAPCVFLNEKTKKITHLSQLRFKKERLQIAIALFEEDN
jgi:predicted HTH domain antitoxin